MFVCPRFHLFLLIIIASLYYYAKSENSSIESSTKPSGIPSSQSSSLPSTEPSAFPTTELSAGNDSYKIHYLLTSPLIAYATTPIMFPMNFLRGCRYTITFWMWLWKPTNIVDNLNHRGEYVIFNTRRLFPQGTRAGHEPLFPALIWNVGRYPSSLFAAGTKDRYDDYNGVWLTEYEMRFYEWIHVTITYTATQMKIFINGEYIRSVAMDNPLIKPLQACPYVFPPEQTLLKNLTKDAAADSSIEEYLSKSRQDSSILQYGDTYQHRTDYRESEMKAGNSSDKFFGDNGFQSEFENVVIQLFSHPRREGMAGMLHDFLVISNYEADINDVEVLMNSNPPPESMETSIWDNILRSAGIRSLRGMCIDPNWRHQSYLLWGYWGICPIEVCGPISLPEGFFHDDYDYSVSYSHRSSESSANYRKVRLSGFIIPKWTLMNQNRGERKHQNKQTKLTNKKLTSKSKLVMTDEEAYFEEAKKVLLWKYETIVVVNDMIEQLKDKGVKPSADFDEEQIKQSYAITYSAAALGHMNGLNDYNNRLVLPNGLDDFYGDAGFDYDAYVDGFQHENDLSNGFDPYSEDVDPNMLFDEFDEYESSSGILTNKERAYQTKYYQSVFHELLMTKIQLEYEIDYDEAYLAELGYDIDDWKLSLAVSASPNTLDPEPSSTAISKLTTENKKKESKGFDWPKPLTFVQQSPSIDYERVVDPWTDESSSSNVLQRLRRVGRWMLGFVSNSTLNNTIDDKHQIKYNNQNKLNKKRNEWSKTFLGKQDKLLSLLLSSPIEDYSKFSTYRLYDSILMYSHHRFNQSKFLNYQTNGTVIPESHQLITRTHLISKTNPLIHLQIQISSFQSEFPENFVTPLLALYLWSYHDAYNYSVDFPIDWNFLYPQIQVQHLFLILGYQARYGAGNHIYIPLSSKIQSPMHNRALFHSFRKSRMNITIDDLFLSLKPTQNTTDPIELVTQIDNPGNRSGNVTDNQPRTINEPLAFKTNFNQTLSSRLSQARYKANSQSNCQRSLAYYYPVTQYIISHYDLVEKSITAYTNTMRGGLGGGFGGGGPGGKGEEGESERELFELNEFLAQHGSIDAQHFLAQRYYWGGYYHDGIYHAQPNYQEAVRYYLLAGVQGQHLPSLYSLGVMYLYGQPDDPKINSSSSSRTGASSGTGSDKSSSSQKSNKAETISKGGNDIGSSKDVSDSNRPHEKGFWKRLFGQGPIMPEGSTPSGRITQNYDLAFKYIHQAAYGYTREKPFKWDKFSSSATNATSTSKEAMKELLEKGYPMAVHALGNLHNDPKLTKYYNKTLAHWYYEAAAYLDSPQGHFSYAALLLNDDKHKDIELGILHMSRGIALGHIRSMNYIAHGLFDPSSWLHNHVREQRHKQRQQFHQLSSLNISVDRKSSSSNKPMDLKSWLNLQTPSSSSHKLKPSRYYILEVNTSQPLVLHIHLPREHIQLPLQRMITINHTRVSSNESTIQGSDRQGTVMEWYYDHQWCETTLRLVRHISEYHPYGTSLVTLGVSTMNSILEPHLDDELLNDNHHDVMSQSMTNTLVDSVGLLDLLDEGAELGYSRPQMMSYRIYHHILTDICPLLSNNSSNAMTYSSPISSQTSNVYTSSSYPQMILKEGQNFFQQLFFQIKQFSIKLLETKMTSYDFRDDAPLTLTSSSSYILRDLPKWITDMSETHCRQYFEYMSLKRLMQLANQNDPVAIRLLAYHILYAYSSVRYDFNHTNVDRDVHLQGVLLLFSTGVNGDVEALISLGWLVYFDHLGLNLNRTLTIRFFQIAFEYERYTSTGGFLSTVAFACYYGLETWMSISDGLAWIYHRFENPSDHSYFSSLPWIYVQEAHLRTIIYQWQYRTRKVVSSFIDLIVFDHHLSINEENKMMMICTALLMILSLVYIFRRKYRR